MRSSSSIPDPSPERERGLAVLALALGLALAAPALGQRASGPNVAPVPAEAEEPAGEPAEAVESPAGDTAAVDSAQPAGAEEPAGPSPEEQRRQAFLKLTFDRSPAAVLRALTAPEEEGAAEEEGAREEEGAGEASAAAAPDPDDPVSGTWQATLTGGPLPEAMTMTVELSLAEDGRTVEGTATPPATMGELPPEPQPLAGTLDGDRLVLESAGSRASSTLEATVADGHLSGTLTSQGITLSIAAERVGGASATAAPSAPAGGPFAAEAAAFQRQVVLGDWAGVGETLADFPEEDGEVVYRHVLSVLAAPPGSQVMPQPDGSVVIQPAPSGPAGALAPQQVLSPDDLRGLADAAPAELEEEDLALLGRLLAASIGQGHALDGLVAAWEAGTERLGGEDVARRHGVAAVLIEAGRPREAGAFLPPADATEDAGVLELLVRYHLGLHGEEAKVEHLEAAWAVNRRLLARDDLEAEDRRAALERAVDLAPKVREALGDAWLEAVFADDPARAAEVLGAIGVGVAGGRAAAFRDPAARLRGLELQRTAVRALLEHARGWALDLRPVLTLLARNWLVEAELSHATDPSVGGGRPQPRWDNFGNLYFERQQQGRIPPNQPLPIPTVEVLDAAPHEAWRALASASLRPRLVASVCELHLKAGDEEEAFPLLEALAEVPGQAERAHGLAEELVRVWTRNHDLNSERPRSRYVFWGFEPRADAIPLTRSQQERSLVELAQLLERLEALPLAEPLDEDLLADAFIRSHSTAEVYRLETIEAVFGPPTALAPATLARLIQTMRANLAGAWRDPRVQKEEETKRTDRELRAEVLRGYEVARRLAREGLAEHPESWELLLAAAAVRFDHVDYAHRELGPSPEYVPEREAAYAGFAAAAEAYAAAVPELAEEDEATGVYDLWFAASLGAVDLPKVSHEHTPDPDQPERIRAAIEALPGEATERHMRRFAHGLFTKLSAVDPAAKYDYLEAGFAIVGDHEDAREARQVFDYYGDLVTEIELRTRVDGSDVVGHERPFGVFVELRHTEAIERESGGFGKYLQNQNNVAFAWNYGRPLEDYRDKFEEGVREVLEERFEVLSVTFAEPEVESRGDPAPGWRITPYAYLLLRTRGPEVDELPAISIDLDFLDTSGYMVLPVESAPLPIDARPEAGDPRPLDLIDVTQTLDERRAGEGVLALEVQAEAHGLVPPLGELLDLEALDPAFEVAAVEDPGVAAARLDLESEELEVVSERRWLVELKGKASLSALPEAFTFPPLADGLTWADRGPEAPAAEVLYQRYEDADLAAVAATVPLEEEYGEAEARWPWILLGGLVVVFAVLAVARLLARPRDEVASGPYAVPDRVTPFSVLALLRRLDADEDFDEAPSAELRQAVARLERRHFAPTNGDGEAGDEDLEALARTWVERGNARRG